MVGANLKTAIGPYALLSKCKFIALSFSAKCDWKIALDSNDFQIVHFSYKKPTDKRRRRLGLLTVKPLFLHLKISLNV
jgi:hypothetical protein